MKFFLISISCVLLTFSCIHISQNKQFICKSNIKLEGKNTDIRDLIEIDGIYGNWMFFEDGTWVEFFLKKKKNDKISNLLYYVNTWKKSGQTMWGVRWGVYTTQNDTIFVRIYEKGHWFREWSFFEWRFKVIDRKAISLVYYKPLFDFEEQYYKENNISPWIQGDTIKFISADTLPSSDCWLKEKKWIWKNESDWKNYMEKIKKK